MRFDTRIAAMLTATVSMSAMAVYARAQNPTELDRIVLEQEAADEQDDGILAQDTASATKIDTPIVELPQSVSVITREQIDKQNPQTVGDSLVYTAGVLTDPDATSRFDSMFIRGFGGFGLTTNFISFLDGLNLPQGQAFAQFQIDPFILERVDVLKGPSSVLYGQVNPGGLVNQVTRTPTADPYNELRIEGGSDGRIQAGYTTQGAFDEAGIWQYGLTAVGRYSGTRYFDVDEQRIAVAPSLAWQPDEDTRLVLQGLYQNDPEGGYFNSIYPTFLAPQEYRPFLNRDFNVGDPTFDSYQREQWTVGYTFEHRFNEWFQFRSNTRYASVTSDLQGVQMAAPLTSTGLLPRQAVISDEQAYGLSTDNQAVFNFATGAVEHEVLAGFDYQGSTSEFEYQGGLAPSLSVVHPVYGQQMGPFFTAIDNTQDVSQTGIYLQDQIAVGNWRGVFGIRHDWTDQKTVNHLAGDARSDQNSSATTYRAGLLYIFDNGLAPYASYSTSFEPVIGVDADGNAFEPTEAEQFEIGVKYEPSFMDVLFTASAFDIRQTNVLTPGAVPGFSVQTGEIRSRGLEFEARGNLNSNLEVIGALTLLDTEVTKSSVSTSIGKRPQAVPDYFASLWMNYTFGGGALEGLAVGSGVRFVGPSFADDANEIEKDGYVIVDLSMRYDLEALNPSLKGAIATLDIKNLFNEDYYTSCTYNFYCQYGSERQFLVGLRKTW